MKKYRIHFIYILLIAALAIASRIKTNDLYDQVDKCKAESEVSRQVAERSAEEANQMARVAKEQEILALEAARRVHEILVECQGK